MIVGRRIPPDGFEPGDGPDRLTTGLQARDKIIPKPQAKIRNRLVNGGKSAPAYFSY
jgi:hypothetical protein